MIFDVIVLLVLIGGIKSGYQNGLLKSILSMAGYIAGAIAGLYFALQYNKSAWVILAIFIGAGLGSFLGTLLAKLLKLTIIRGPLAWINSAAGALFEIIAISIVAFLVGTALLMSPWASGQNVVATSKIYLQLNTYMPHILSSTFSTITQKFEE